MYNKGEINMNNTNKKINIVAQAFYGNRVGTEINLDEVDKFILGYTDNSIEVTEKINRTIVNIPNTDNVIVYNKYQEENELNRKEELMKNNGYVLKPLAVITEENIEIYSRCIVCRINADGELDSLQSGDYEKFVHYLAE